MSNITISSPNFVQFNGSRILVTTHDDKPYVAIKPICEALGLDWDAQRQRIKRDTVLDSTAVIITVVAEDGRNRESVCLPLEFLNGWLFGVSESRVKVSLREKLVHYKRECYHALNNYFNPQRLPTATKIHIDALAELEGVLEVVHKASKEMNFMQAQLHMADAKIRLQKIISIQKSLQSKSKQLPLAIPAKPIDAKAVLESCDELNGIINHFKLLNQQQAVSKPTKKIADILLSATADCTAEITKQVISYA